MRHVIWCLALLAACAPRGEAPANLQGYTPAKPLPTRQHVAGEETLAEADRNRIEKFAFPIAVGWGCPAVDRVADAYRTAALGYLGEKITGSKAVVSDIYDAQVQFAKSISRPHAQCDDSASTMRDIIRTRERELASRRAPPPIRLVPVPIPVPYPYAVPLPSPSIPAHRAPPSEIDI